ncbi:hypothetical protein FPQ18DRAFT_39282 [Pyronema domesticum]|uniref:Uncharacterized protein n=1 Tax=Pyronema omphalodes (strain CBS 100304) TaxID=1076935 RepID=U4LQH3_PYROM|nr:hypothetical protein FPQ18DRAFT_39282 [Pyronema domesticum]CCX33789.1 Similar to hypothetical protein [Tuber melanosporum Mel28]; acc. no. XP_002839494 [Pyronema omphalodes CBS 100304]
MADFTSIWSPAKVFSPTVARQQSQQLREWQYIDNFLTSKFHPNPVPPFERNADTLKALMALASANESADESRSLEIRVKEKALDELKKREAAEEEKRRGKGEPLLVGVEENLTSDGRRCLNSVALLSVALGSGGVGEGRIANHLLDLSIQETSLSLQSTRIEALHTRLLGELSSLREILRDLNTNPVHTLPPDINNRITEWSRTTRHLSNKMEDYKERLQTVEQKPGLTVPELIEKEKEVLTLKELVLDLEGQAKGFQGLPPEKDLARVEVERVQAELEELERVREGLYDTMVGR